MTIALALACGLIIGIVLGGLGGGGSVLAVPALVYVLGESPRDATTTSLVIVGLSAAVALVAHQREHTVRWGTGVTFAVVGLAFTALGTLLNARVSDETLLVSFAGLLLVSATAMFLRAGRDRRRAASVEPEADCGSVEPDVVLPSRSIRRRVREWLAHLSWRRVTAIVVAGAVVGFLTGFLGVGGGFIAVPALVLALGLPMPVAAGTSLLVIALNSATALAARVQVGIDLDLAVVVPFTIAAIGASLIGHRVARRLPAHVLTVGFASVLAAVGVGIGVQATLALL